MNPRTRSDILAASSGMNTPRAALTMFTNSIGRSEHSEARRITLDALEYAIEAAREDVAPSREELIRENEALKLKIGGISDLAARIFDMTEEA